MNITIGQYYNVKSEVHGLDARTKIIATAVFIASVMAANNFLGYALAAVFVLWVSLLAKLPIKLMLKSLKGIMFIILFTVVMNLLFNREGDVVFTLGAIKITTNGVSTSLMIAARLVLLVMGSSVLTLTTEPLKLTVGIEYILKPFKRIGVPAHEIAMMMSIALRFIPTLMDELEKIKKAQMSRGADFETGGIIKKANALVPLLVPLFVSAFKRADELAEAMDSRCYRGDVNRTRLHPLVYKKYDYIAFAVMLLYLVIIVLSVILF